MSYFASTQRKPAQSIKNSLSIKTQKKHTICSLAQWHLTTDRVTQQKSSCWWVILSKFEHQNDPFQLTSSFFYSDEEVTVPVDPRRYLKENKNKREGSGPCKRTEKGRETGMWYVWSGSLRKIQRKVNPGKNWNQLNINFIRHYWCTRNSSEKKWKHE